MANETALEAVTRLSEWLRSNKVNLSVDAIKEVVMGDPAEADEGQWDTWPPSYIRFLAQTGGISFVNPDMAEPKVLRILTPKSAEAFQLEMEDVAEDVDGYDASHLMLFGICSDNPLDAYVFNSERRDLGEMPIQNWYHGEPPLAPTSVRSFDLWMSTQVDYIISHRGEL